MTDNQQAEPNFARIVDFDERREALQGSIRRKVAHLGELRARTDHNGRRGGGASVYGEYGIDPTEPEPPAAA